MSFTLIFLQASLFFFCNRLKHLSADYMKLDWKIGSFLVGGD